MLSRRIAPLAVVWLLACPALGQPDFAPEGDAWNGVSELLEIARQRGALRWVERLDAGTLQPTDAVLVIEPETPPPAAAVTEFLRAGGRVAIADDFGAGESLLRTFQIGRAEPSGDRAPRLRGNPALLVARPHGRHRLTTGVPALVTNHPSIVYHRELAPIFELADGEAVVLAGAVGEGRLVALGDPSALINNMLQLGGNRRFAENLVDYLGERGGTLYVLGPEARLVGRFGEPGADRPFHEPRAWLEQLAHIDLPPLAVRVGTLALAAIAAILALGVLPSRTPYRSERMFARPSADGGFVGRVAYFGRGGGDLLSPLMVYKFELEAELLKRLSLKESTVLRDVVTAARRRGMLESDLADLRKLLLTLDSLREQVDRPPAPPRIGERRFRALVATGERLLSLLEPVRS